MNINAYECSVTEIKGIKIKKRESCNAAKLAVDMSDTMPAHQAVRKSTHCYDGVMSAVKGMKGEWKCFAC